MTSEMYTHVGPHVYSSSLPVSTLVATAAIPETPPRADLDRAQRLDSCRARPTVLSRARREAAFVSTSPRKKSSPASETTKEAQSLVNMHRRDGVIFQASEVGRLMYP